MMRTHTPGAQARALARAAWTLGMLLAAGLWGPAAVWSQPVGEAPCREELRTVYRRVAPAVVRLAALGVVSAERSDRVDRSIGAGVLVDAAGLVLTNAHVVLGQSAVRATLMDGTSLPAQVVGTDPLLDVALVRLVGAPRRLPTAVLGTSATLEVGAEVFAIGYPYGGEQTLSRGIVAGLNRDLPVPDLGVAAPLIQVDAPINPGNSGGPLLDRCGRVVGLTNAFLKNAQNIGFAIPIDVIQAILPALRDTGHVARPWLGVRGHMVTPTLARFIRLPWQAGLLLERIEPDSPAAQAGLRGGEVDLMLDGDALLLGGDILTRLNGRPLDTPEVVAAAIQSLRIGEHVRVTFAREGEMHEVSIVLPERPVLPTDVLEAAGGAVRPAGALRYRF